MHEQFMGRALELAILGKHASPNPKVGCVIVKNNKIISQGYHQEFGKEHAEINALDGVDAKGCDMYVTLEPCSHQGKTPPCVKKVIKSGISKVYVAMKDPNPLVSGKGIKELEKNGIKVEVGILSKEAKRLNESFVKFITTKIPFVILKVGMSSDEKITSKDKYITNELSRKRVHELRDEMDAILVGINTVLNDNPMLNCRLDNGRDPLRIIVDSKLRIPLDSNVLFNNNVLIVTTNSFDKEKKYELEKKGIKIIVCGNKKVDFKQMLVELGNIGISSLLVEGGLKINTSFLKEKLVDKVMFFVSPKTVGEGLKYAELEKPIDLKEKHITILGEDKLIEGYL